MIREAETSWMSCGISPPFGGLSPTSGQVTHVLLTRLPLYSRAEARFLVRLACVRHAASVRSEPGSNSPVRWWNPAFSGSINSPPSTGSLTNQKADVGLLAETGRDIDKQQPSQDWHVLFRFQRTSHRTSKDYYKSYHPCQGQTSLELCGTCPCRAKGS